MTPQGRILFHFATGGFAHFLRLFENSLQWASRWGFRVAVITRPAKTLAFRQFDELFRTIRPLPLVDLDDIPARLLIRPNGVTVTEYLDHWGGGPCVLRAGEKEEVPVSLTFANRLAMTPQLTIGNQKRFFPRPYEFLLPRLGLSERLAEEVSSTVSAVPTRGVVGVHFRNTDSPGDLDDTLTRLDHTIRDTGLSTVLWCSDDPHSLDRARTAFSDLDFLEGSAKPPIKPGWGSLHGGVDDDKVDWMFTSTLIDIALLSTTEYFLPAPNSAWAELIPYFRTNTQVRDSFFMM